MVWKFIKDLFKGFCRSYDGIGIWFSALSAALFWLFPSFDSGVKMNAIIATISLPYRLLIVLGFIFISVILTSYSLYNNQQKDIESLKRQHNSSFFDKNIDIAVNCLEYCANEINKWFSYVKTQPGSHLQELKDVLTKMALNFLPTDKKSESIKSIDDSIEDILLFLKDFKPNMDLTPENCATCN